MERTESFGLRNTFQQARQSELIKLKSGMLNTVGIYYTANLERTPANVGSFFMAEEPFQTAPVGLSSTDGIMACKYDGKYISENGCRLFEFDGK